MPKTETKRTYFTASCLNHTRRRCCYSCRRHFVALASLLVCLFVKTNLLLSCRCRCYLPILLLNINLQMVNNGIVL